LWSDFNVKGSNSIGSKSKSDELKGETTWNGYFYLIPNILFCVRVKSKKILKINTQWLYLDEK